MKKQGNGGDFFPIFLLERRIDSYKLLIDKFPVIRQGNDSLKKSERKWNCFDKNVERSIN